MDREIRKGLLRILYRALPLAALIGLGLAYTGPHGPPLIFGFGLAIGCALVLILVWNRRLRRAGIGPRRPGEPLRRLKIEFRASSIGLLLAASIGLGVVASTIEKRFEVDLGDWGVPVIVPLLLLILGLNAKVKPIDSNQP